MRQKFCGTTNWDTATATHSFAIFPKSGNWFMTVKVFCSILLLLCLALSGCASKVSNQMQIRRAYAAGEQAARAQMQQAQQSQPALPTPDSADPQIRIFGPVRNPVLPWSEGLTLARAFVEAEYQKPNTPVAITIYRNNEPLHVDPQRMLQGEDFPLFPGDIVYIQD
jgi:hypothetical protein